MKSSTAAVDVAERVIFHLEREITKDVINMCDKTEILLAKDAISGTDD